MRTPQLGFVLAIVACGTDPNTGDDDNPQARATWYQDVAPIAAKHCMGCHQAGGIGPFDMTTYDIAAENAPRMLSAIEAGTMPPFDARESAECTPRFSWVDDPRLSTAEIDKIKMWIDDGLPAGTPAPLPPIAGTELSGVTKTLTPAVPFTASGTRDQFVCYVLDPQIVGGAWMTGMQVRPGNPTVVHHVVVAELGPGTDQDALVAQHGIGMPWDCSQTAIPAGFIVNLWTPGNQPFQTSTDLAVPIVGGAKFVVNIHYHPTGATAAPDATQLDMRLSSTWPKKMYFVGGFGNEATAPNLLADPDDRLAGTPEFRIPANIAAHNEHMRITVPSLGDLTEVKLYSVNPHMHMIGTGLSVTVERPAPRGTDPQTECLANGKWNFDWQRTYIYNTSLDQLPSLRPGDVIDMKCTWDNTMANPFVQRALADAGLIAPIDVNLGEGSLDEMCLEIFGFAIDAPPPPAMRQTPTLDDIPLSAFGPLRTL